MMHDAKAMLNELKAGNERYVANLSSTEKIPIPPPTLVKEQKPNAIILGCSDARVPVELIFDQGLGDLFVIRVAGNVVAPSGLVRWNLPPRSLILALWWYWVIRTVAPSQHALRP